jgi:ferredoxin-NADP reductase
MRLESGDYDFRAYSLCSDPADRSAYEIAVLRHDDGRGGSRAVHLDFEVGHRLRCDLPRNSFALHTDSRAAILIAGGIGITPIKSMATVLQARGSVYELHYAVRSEREAAFGTELRRALGDRAMLYSAEHGVRMDIDHLLSAAAPDAVVYACGPARMLDAVTRAAGRLSIPRDRLRVERFVAAVPPDAKRITVELRRSGQTVHVRSDQTILDALLEAGIDAPYSCRAGICKTCAVVVLAGEAEHRDTALTDADRTHLALMCPCISRARTDRLVLDL